MIDRYYIPGSEWLYFKIYTGYKSADLLLSDSIRDLTLQLLENRQIDAYFFIRYSDPDFHIRLRFHIPDTNNYTEVMASAYKTFYPLFTKNLIKTLLCDTYMREIERYGNDTMTAVEKIFFIDSQFIIEMLHILAHISIPDSIEQLRWRIAIKLVDDIFQVFPCDLKIIKEHIGQISESFRQEFRFTQFTYTKQLNDLYRENRNLIAETLETTTWSTEIISILQQRKMALLVQAKTIRDLNQISENPVNEYSLIGSLIHMTMNRWFRHKNRLHEMIIYSFLSKYYESKYARLKYNKL